MLCLLHSSMPIWSIHFIYGTNTTNEGTATHHFQVKRSNIKVTGLWSFHHVRFVALYLFDRFPMWNKKMRWCIPHHFQVKRQKVKVIRLVWFLAATKQLYEWYFLSVCLSVCLSVRLSVTPFWLCSHHRIIMKFSGVITTDQGNVHAKGQGQRSKVKVTEVTTQLRRFRTVTPVWINIWWWNDAYSLMLLRRGALLFFKVIRQISRSHGSKNRRIWPRLGVSGL